MRRARFAPAGWSRVCEPDTIADGLRGALGEYPFAEIRRYVEDIVTVPESAIVAAMRRLWEVAKIVVEPSGAVPYAAMDSGRLDVQGQRVGIVLSGGNVDLEQLPWMRRLHPLEDERDPLPDADAHGAQRVTAAPVARAGRSRWWRAARRTSRAGGRARSRRRSGSRARRRRAGPARAAPRAPGQANASLSSITSSCASSSRASSSTLRVAGSGPMPMIRGATPAVAAATTRARGVSPCRRAASSEATMSAQAPSLTPEALPAVTVPSARNGVGERRELLERRLGARMLVALHHQWRALALRDLDRHQLGGEEAARVRRRGALLAAQRERVLIGARDAELRGDVLAGLGHRVDAVLRAARRGLTNRQPIVVS